MNRETKRMMQRQGTVGSDGTAAADATGAAPAARRSRPDSGGAPERVALPERTVEYLRDVRSELQKVAWPGRAEVTNYTVVVFITVVLVTLLVFGLDYGFAKGVIYLFQK